MYTSPQPSLSMQSDIGDVKEHAPSHIPQGKEIVEVEDEDDKEDVRLPLGEKFVFDDDFIYSQEFKTFLYRYKGKLLRKQVGEIIHENELELIAKLQIMRLPPLPLKQEDNCCRKQE